jgi:hypothetical protein
MASGGQSLPISLAGVTHTASGITIPALRLWVELAFTRQIPPPLPRKCLLDTGAPLSVIPYAVHHTHSFSWQPLSGPWPPGFTSWLGVPCIVGLIDVWVPVAEAPFLNGPWKCIAKFAQATPANMPTNLPILLGLNFLADHQAGVSIQSYQIPNAGSIFLP